jgi:hypothetical protein
VWQPRLRPQTTAFQQPISVSRCPLWVEDDRRGAESSGPLCSGTPSFPIEWLLRDADLPVESVGWPVLAGHLPSLMVGRYPTVLHRDSDLVGADN